MKISLPFFVYRIEVDAFREALHLVISVNYIPVNLFLVLENHEMSNG